VEESKVDPSAAGVLGDVVRGVAAAAARRRAREAVVRRGKCMASLCSFECNVMWV
jgi:hypothetical protein